MFSFSPFRKDHVGGTKVRGPQNVSDIPHKYHMKFIFFPQIVLADTLLSWYHISTGLGALDVKVNPTGVEKLPLKVTSFQCSRDVLTPFPEA
jgi:hypothetical protein